MSAFELGKTTGVEAADRLIANLKFNNPAGIMMDLWELYDIGCIPPFNPGPPSSIRKAESEVQLEYGKGFDVGFMLTVNEQLGTKVPDDIEAERREYLLKKYGVRFKKDRPVLEEALCH